MLAGAALKPEAPAMVGQTNQCKAPPPAASLDPFADLMGGSWSSKPTTPLTSGGNSPMTGSPMHQNSSWLPTTTQANTCQPTPTQPPTWQPPQQQQFTPRHQGTTPASQANYGRTNFDNLTGAAPGGAAPAKTPAAATFDDLLGFKGFNFTTSSKDSGPPKTMAQMKKEEMVKTMDPERRKVSLVFLALNY